MRRSMFAALAAGLFNAALSAAFAADVMIADADTLVLDGVIYRLDGIDAPQTDQVCLNADGAVWSCGIEARDRVREFVHTGAVKCETLGFDTNYRNRRIGLCTVDGENLNEWIVKHGWAINSEPYARGRYKPAEADAKGAGRGLWNGCFVTRKSWRYADKRDATLLGSKCPSNEAETREQLFPRHPAMPENCPIKGRRSMRARFTGHVGIYHLQSCRSYGRLTNPDRWFCTEAEAQAEGYRKAFTCANR